MLLTCRVLRSEYLENISGTILNICCGLLKNRFLQSIIITTGSSNHILGRVVWDKLPKFTFEDFRIARVKRGQFQVFQKLR